MFEFVEEWEIDWTALGISTVIFFAMFVLMIQDPLNAGMDRLPLVSRIIGLAVSWVGGYFFARLLINR